MRGGQPHGVPRRPAQHQPPSIGHGPRDLFGQIMAGGGAQGQSSLAPPPQEPPQPQGMPAHLTQGSGLSTGPQPPQHQPYPGYGGQGMNGEIALYTIVKHAASNIISQAMGRSPLH